MRYGNGQNGASRRKILEIVRVMFTTEAMEEWNDSEFSRTAAHRLSLAELHALKHLRTKTAAELDSLLPAILDRALKGEL